MILKDIKKEKFELSKSLDAINVWSKNKSGKIFKVIRLNIGKNAYEVIELKAGIADFKVFGQISMYLGLLKKEFPQKIIKGIIIAGKIDESLKYATTTNENVRIMEYKMELIINEII